MAEAHPGTLTFLFTDIEGSTSLLQRLGDRLYAQVLADHNRLSLASLAVGSQKVEDRGDGFLVTFSRAKDAVAAAVAAQRAITGHTWPNGETVRVRMGLHTGEPVTDRAGYVGLDIHRAARICAAGHGGQILLSETTYTLVARDLLHGTTIKDLGEHRLKDLQRPERLYQIVHSGLPAAFPPLRSLDTLPNNLPRQLTSFVGRQREIVEVKGLLGQTTLLSLTGAGGSGKTRLALQVAADALDDFADGVWVAELAAVGDSALVPREAADALGVQEEPGRPLEATLIDYLHSKQLLLIMDNCEHLLSACTHLAETLLRHCPSLRILATSREGLGIAGELTYRVPSLALPGLTPPGGLGPLSRCESVRLFVERARFVEPGFALSDENAAAVAQICNRLDGIPLAIELAAARVNVLTADEIAGRLGDRFRLLTGGSRTAMPRQQTLRAAMDWSYDLLSLRERSLLRRLSVFVGGFALEAVESVCIGDEVEVGDILDLLAHLVDKSLVMMEERGGRARYRLLETVRQYGRDKLVESGEAPAIRDRHLEYFHALAHQADEGLRGSEQLHWLNRLEIEHDNIRTALDWALGGVRAEVGIRFAALLVLFWLIRGYTREGRDWFEKALARLDEVPASAQAEALSAAGFLSRFLGQLQDAAARSDTALAIYTRLGDKRGISNALISLGVVALVRGDRQQAFALHEESLRLRREIGDTWGAAVALEHMGTDAWVAGEYDRAETFLQESLVLRRALGDSFGIANALGFLAIVANWRHDLDRATALHHESLELLRKLGDKRGIAMRLVGLASTSYIQGDYVRAAALVEESLSLLRELGDRHLLMIGLNVLGSALLRQGDAAQAGARYCESLEVAHAIGAKAGVANSLIGLAALAAAQERNAQAGRLIGAGMRIREGLVLVMPPIVQQWFDETTATLRRNLGDDAYDQLVHAGWSMTDDEAVTYALAVSRVR